MRYAVFADIHGNLEAFEAVLGDISRDRIDAYLFLGDAIGYGADPGTCVERLSSLSPLSGVAGNHEWGVLGLMGPDRFNELAYRSIIWTKNALDEGLKDLIRGFHTILHAKAFVAVHGSLEDPEEFRYLADERDALYSARLLMPDILFVGHTHRQEAFQVGRDGHALRAYGPYVKIEAGIKYIVNPGSVGQPRDGDVRAAYAVYDDSLGVIVLRRVGYNITLARRKILRTSLPESLADRLILGQ